MLGYNAAARRGKMRAIKERRKGPRQGLDSETARWPETNGKGKDA